MSSSIFVLRDWRTSKFPLRILIRAMFLTYMLGGFIQGCHGAALADFKAYGFEFLTLIGFVGTHLVVFLSLFNEFIPILKPIKIGLNSLFLTTEVLITMLYWSIYFYDKYYILSAEFLKSCNDAPPVFMDTSAHLVPVLTMAYEFFQTRSSKNHLYNQRAVHFTVIGAFTISYFIWIVYLFDEDQKFPYPFLVKMNHSGRTAFAIFSMFLGLFVFGLINRAYYMYHETKDDLPVFEQEYEDEEEFV